MIGWPLGKETYMVVQSGADVKMCNDQLGDRLRLSSTPPPLRRLQ